MKQCLVKIVGRHRLRADDITTALTDIEAILNSRPITLFEAHEEDGSVAITPGHYLIGRPLLAIAMSIPDSSTTGLNRWNLVKRLTYDLHRLWLKEYLHFHHRRFKWHVLLST